MATKVIINGKPTQRAGVYATIKSGIKNPTTSRSYSNVLIIDDGIGANFGGGSGVNGQLQQGINSVYKFSSLQDFQAFVKGGELWNLGSALFNPSGNQLGIADLYLVQARTTTHATVTVDTAGTGIFAISTKDEGLNANGVVDVTSGNLSAGYGYKIIASGSKFIFQLFHSTYKGADANNSGLPYDGVTIANAKPQLIVQSPAVTTVAELITWFQNNQDFNTGFNLEAGFVSTGNFASGDITPAYVPFTGATETYNPSDFDNALAAVNNLDFTHILSMKYGANATGGNNDKLFDFIKNKSKYDRLLVVAGGFDKANFDGSSGTSTNTAAYYNNDEVIVVHGGVKKKSKNAPSGYKIYSQLFHAALILGRCAGLPSQVPVTMKSLDINGEVHPLSDDEIETAISKGVVVSYYDYELLQHVVALDITSIQQNDFLINNDGTTYNWALKRIEAELNKFIITTGKKRFFDPNGFGGNRNTTSPEEVVSWVVSQLTSRTASAQKDDLIIKASNVNASIDKDNLYLTYDFVGNTEIKAIVSTGTLIEG
jgi:hypothetical protein